MEDVPNPPPPPPPAPASRDALLAQVYEQLRRLAAQALSQQAPGQTLQPTALVHEAFMRLSSKPDLHWQSPAHLYGALAIAMRYVLVDHARARLALKRGGKRARVPLEEAAISFDADSTDILALDELLSTLSVQHPRQAELLTLKFFAGLTDEQTANVLQVSTKTIQRDMRFARAWLLAHWQGEAPGVQE